MTRDRISYRTLNLILKFFEFKVNDYWARIHSLRFKDFIYLDMEKIPTKVLAEFRNRFLNHPLMNEDSLWRACAEAQCRFKAWANQAAAWGASK